MRGTLVAQFLRADQIGIIPAYAGNTYKHVRGWKFRRDHPRVCGEHVVGERKGSVQTGSSPRMRGTPFPTSKPCVTMGIIPAYAGNTSVRLESRARWRDHPRVCGEHAVKRKSDWPRPGSSPRMRGTLRQTDLPSGHVGIIPAYAGNTGILKNLLKRIGDHPRVCGEHLISDFNNAGYAGSSPRMRGTLLWKPSTLSTDGIIPAYAGNTSAFMISFAICRDHPRVCGEHDSQIGGWNLFGGSSPRMRGTPDNVIRCTDCTGIIPAYAGNTDWIRLAIMIARDHPRVCGEHLYFQFSCRHCPGSSPRMRGTLGGEFRHDFGWGIIPAYAGNTHDDPIGILVQGDHPRVCGEHPPKRCPSTDLWGSSPRMRGTLCDGIHHVQGFGIIPAYAGNTTIDNDGILRCGDHPRVCGEHHDHRP